MTNRLPPNDPFPLFLSERTKPEHRGIGKTRLSIISSLFLAAVIMFAVLLLANPLVLLANTMASPVNPPRPDERADHSIYTIQSTASAQALAPIQGHTARGDALDTAFKSGFERQTEVDHRPTEALLNQFQAWAAKEKSQAEVQPSPEAMQDTRAQVVQRARAEPLPKPRPIHAGRAQDRSPQNAHWAMPSFGWRN
jgi:hypothetical protein